MNKRLHEKRRCPRTFPLGPWLVTATCRNQFSTKLGNRSLCQSPVAILGPIKVIPLFFQRSFPIIPDSPDSQCHQPDCATCQIPRVSQGLKPVQDLSPRAPSSCRQRKTAGYLPPAWRDGGANSDGSRCKGMLCQKENPESLLQNLNCKGFWGEKSSRLSWNS